MRVAAVVVAGALLAAGVTVPADAAVPSVPHRYAPVTGTLFNIPYTAGGTAAQAYVLSETFVKSVNATPKGQWITVSTYGLDIPKVADALIAAHKRGVNVRVTVWNQRANNPASNKLRAAVGTNIYARSFFKACVGSCRLSGTAGLNHTKVATISAVINTKKQVVRYITFAGSANFTYTNATASWNNTDVYVSAKAIYDSANKYALFNKYDVTQKNYPSLSSGSYRFNYFPRSSSRDSVVLAALNGTSCKASSSTGYLGRTVVRVAMFDWTTARRAIASRLIYLKKHGCNVYVNLSARSVSPSLINDMAKAGIPVYDANKDLNHNGLLDVYQHGKTTIISGRVSGAYRNLVYSGSGNFTRNSITDNTENIQTNTSRAAYVRYIGWFNRVQKSSTRIYKAPPVLSLRSADSRWEVDFDTDELSKER